MKYESGLSFSTDGRKVSIEYNEKLIKKAGKIEVFLDETNTAHLSITDWTIAGKNRFKKLRKLFGRKQSAAIVVDGSNTSIIFEGENNVMTEEENYRHKLIYMIGMAEGYQYILENDYGHEIVNKDNLEDAKKYIKKLKEELGMVV